MSYRLSICMVLVGLVGLVAGACAERAEPPAPAEPVAVGPTLDEEELWQQAAVRFRPLPLLAESEGNPLSPVKVELGRALYFDPRLSSDETVSCNSCHDLATFGVDNRPFSPGVGGALGGRNSPTVLNAALHVAQFWDGRASDVEEQAGMPILNPVEMAIPSEEFLVERLRAISGMNEQFAAAFPEDDPALTYRNIGRALGAFERTLLTPSDFDLYLRGDREALTLLEREGLKNFMRLGCSSCHNGVNVGAVSFRKFGLNEDYWEHTKSSTVDRGRFEVTGREDDLYVFKVAALRNVEKTGPYFHDGSIGGLEEAVRVMGALQIGRELTDAEGATIAAFLRSLTGELPTVEGGGGVATPGLAGWLKH